MQFTSVYPQKVNGNFRKLKDKFSYLLLLIYFGTSWIRWDRGDNLPNQAILIDIPNRKAYLFGIEIWPEEIYYIALLLICAALGLFFVTSLFGRIWCGFGCPHTVFVDLFMKVESWVQGDRNARIKLDQSGDSREKFRLKLKTHILWLLLGFAFAYGWVCYFYDAIQLLKDILTFNVRGAALIWLIALTASTYLFAGFIREKVCTYMCPYGRFQSAMLDKDTFVITYHDWRGEPRGKVDNSGDCIDCHKCVHVCPMGIDIRDGLQLKCIGCGLCVDACNSVMEKLHKPLNLVGYDSVNSTNAKKTGASYNINVFKTKTILFLSIFIIVCAFAIYSLVNKSPFEINILHDRGALFTTLPNGDLRNSYTLKIFNKESKLRHIHLTISSSRDFSFLVQNATTDYVNEYEFDLKPDGNIELTVFVKTSPKEITLDKYDLIFNLHDSINDTNIITKEPFLSKSNASNF